MDNPLTNEFTINMRKSMQPLFEEFFADRKQYNTDEYDGLVVLSVLETSDPQWNRVTFKFKVVNQCMMLGYDWASWTQRNMNRVICAAGTDTYISGLR